VELMHLLQLGPIGRDLEDERLGGDRHRLRPPPFSSVGVRRAMGAGFRRRSNAGWCAMSTSAHATATGMTARMDAPPSASTAGAVAIAVSPKTVLLRATSPATAPIASPMAVARASMASIQPSVVAAPLPP